MKKFIMVCLVMVLAVSMGVSVFAATGGFVSSPSGNAAPELVEGKNSDEDCEAELIITAYSDRDKLSEEARKKIEDAYAQILGAEELSALNESIAEIAEKLSVDAADLAVSDLFDISATACDGHGDHGHFDITLKSETLNNFVCLLHYYDGAWHIVENAEVTNNGEHLEFDEDQLSPFAIVVSVGAAPKEPSNVGVVVAVASGSVVAVGGAGAFAVLKLRKKKA